MMRHRLRSAFIVSLAVTMLAACGGGSSGDATTSPTSTSSNEPDDAGASNLGTSGGSSGAMPAPPPTSSDAGTAVPPPGSGGPPPGSAPPPAACPPTDLTTVPFITHGHQALSAFTNAEGHGPIPDGTYVLESAVAYADSSATFDPLRGRLVVASNNLTLDYESDAVAPFAYRRTVAGTVTYPAGKTYVEVLQTCGPTSGISLAQYFTYEAATETVILVERTPPVLARRRYHRQ